MILKNHSEMGPCDIRVPVKTIDMFVIWDPFH